MRTPQEAYDEADDRIYRGPVGLISTFVCAYGDCGALAVHRWGVVDGLLTRATSTRDAVRVVSKSPLVVLSRCEACEREAIFVDGRLVVPEANFAPAAPTDLPQELADDFEEARRILPVSPRGAAALLRLLVQKLLPLLGAAPGDINRMIGELVANGTISSKIQQALDSVRIIGNEAVHPGTMDLKDDEATAISLFKLICYIVEKAITEPKEIDAIYAGLPAGKLAGIVNRDSSGGN